MTPLFRATEEIATSIQVVENLRRREAVARLLVAIKAGKIWDFNEKALVDEIALLTDATGIRDFDLEGTAGLEEAVTSRTNLQRQMSRLVEINRQLRGVQRIAQRVMRTGALWVRQEDIVAQMTKADAAEVTSMVFRELTDVLDSAKRLLDETKDATMLLTDRIRAIDSWFALHKQYTFLTLNRGPGDRNG